MDLPIITCYLSSCLSFHSPPHTLNSNCTKILSVSEQILWLWMMVITFLNLECKIQLSMDCLPFSPCRHLSCLGLEPSSFKKPFLYKIGLDILLWIQLVIYLLTLPFIILHSNCSFDISYGLCVYKYIV